MDKAKPTREEVAAAFMHTATMQVQVVPVNVYESTASLVLVAHARGHL